MKTLRTGKDKGFMIAWYQQWRPRLEEAGATDLERFGRYAFCQLPGRLVFIDLSDSAWAAYESATGNWLVKGDGVESLVLAASATMDLID